MHGLQLYSFEVGKARTVRSIVLSNSCDISEDNARTIAPKKVFTPIVRLSAIEARFRSRGLTGEAIGSKLDAIESQTVTNVFYLPSGAKLKEDYVAFLGDLHSTSMVPELAENKLFTLSMPDFYMFTFKLSVHFCRLQEDVDRRPWYTAL